MSGWLRPHSAPTGGDVAVCPHCWGVNVGGERLCGRCGADMTLLLQESGGLRRTPAVQSPVPVRVSHRLGPVMRAALLLMTALLAAAWLVAPLLGSARFMTTRRHGDAATRRSGRPLTVRGPKPRGPEASFGGNPAGATPQTPRPRVPASAGRREKAVPVKASGRVRTW